MFASQKVGIEVSHFHGPHIRAGIKVGISLSQARTNSDSTFRDSRVCLRGYGNQVPLLRASLGISVSYMGGSSARHFTSCPTYRVR